MVDPLRLVECTSLKTRIHQRTNACGREVALFATVHVGTPEYDAQLPKALARRARPR